MNCELFFKIILSKFSFILGVSVEDKYRSTMAKKLHLNTFLVEFGLRYCALSSLVNGIFEIFRQICKGLEKTKNRHRESKPMRKGRKSRLNTFSLEMACHPF